MVLDGLLGLYGLKYDSTTAYGLPLYLCSYKLVGSTTEALKDVDWVNAMHKELNNFTRNQV